MSSVFIHLFNKCVLSACSRPSTVPNSYKYNEEQIKYFSVPRFLIVYCWRQKIIYKCMNG